jgi:hypothetical protein
MCSVLALARLHRFRRLVAIAATVLLLAVAAHGVSESLSHEHGDQGAIVACALVLAVIGALRPGGGGRTTKVRVLPLWGALPAIEPMPRARPRLGRSPALLQRFLF